MAAQPLDVLVIGGGIVGAGIARDAAHARPAGRTGRAVRLCRGHERPIEPPAPRRAPLSGPGPDRIGARGQLGKARSAPHRAAPGRAFAVSVPVVPWHALAALAASHRREVLRPVVQRPQCGPQPVAQQGRRLRTNAGPGASGAQRGGALLRRPDQRCPAGDRHASFGVQARSHAAKLLSVGRGGQR